MSKYYSTNVGRLVLGESVDSIVADEHASEFRKFCSLPFVPTVTAWYEIQENPSPTAKKIVLKNGNYFWVDVYRDDYGRQYGYNLLIQMHTADGHRVQHQEQNNMTYAFVNKSGATESNTTKLLIFLYFNIDTNYDRLLEFGVAHARTYAPGEVNTLHKGDNLRFYRLLGAYRGDIEEFFDGSDAPVFPGEDNEKDPEGGDGEGPEGIEDDPIESPEDPSISAVDSGLLTLYTPTLNQIHEFGNFLWSDLFSLDTFKKLFSDPMQAVIGLSALPISVPSSGAQNIIIGSVDSGVSANRASKQFVRKDCGTIHIKPTWNTALDYEPYTKFSIFLPYIGTRELKTDDIMNKDINVSYLIDILSGSCTAHIKVGGSVLYQFSGSCAVPIPVTGTSWNNLLTSCIQLAGAGIVTAASGGAASAAVAGAMAASSTANMVANAKPNIQRTGAVSGAAGMLGVQTPYLIRETPRQSLAKGYNKFVGYPSNITSKLSDLNGYTQVENIHLENLSCTADEAAEIESLLKEGVII